MSYQALIDRNLNRAFNSIKDLAKVVTLTRNTAAAFNFGTGESAGTPISNTFKAVLIEAKKSNKERNNTAAQLMFKTADAPILTANDTVVIDTISWKVGNYLKSDGYISLIEIHKE